MVDGPTIRSAIRVLQGAAPGVRVILFGSHARGDARPDSDVDFLVIEPAVGDRYGEMVRLREALGDVPASVDIVVMSEERFQHWKDTPNTLPYRASREGRVYERLQ